MSHVQYKSRSYETRAQTMAHVRVPLFGHPRPTAYSKPNDNGAMW